ncbi:hypothetical protein [Pseudanabaena yagii]|uniref:Uncharacterized protein n=1 Tax=Pseudanabaena yagii GIHE-NHR1 TaxID=2722753 RepID=A0ABX1LTQ5_9CYAN|nr:hypothetical protein [Pseudanabaena yagii]NMF58154.1 hypothetical protein [Pseudanabaena yagii GIHE-NHR1]
MASTPLRQAQCIALSHRADRIQSLRDLIKSSSLSEVEGTVNEAKKSPPRG